MSHTDITIPREPQKGQTPMQRLDDLCLEICQKFPLAGYDSDTGKVDPDKKLVNATTNEERRELLKLAEKSGIGIEGLVSIIRGNDGHYAAVIRRLQQAEQDKLRHVEQKRVMQR